MSEDPRSAAGSMARMLGVGQDEPLWTAEDIAAIVRHQMAAPLEVDLVEYEPRIAERLRSLTADGGPPLRSFADVFAHPAPPVWLLELVKEFAKSRGAMPRGPLPPGAATLLYIVTLTVARLKCGQPITELDDRALAERIVWALALPWIDRTVRVILENGRETLAAARPKADTAAEHSGVSTDVRLAVDADGAPPAASQPALPALGQLGEYRLLRKLGAGGMGVVYQALHVELDRIVAIKVVHPERVADDEAVSRFRREIKAVGRLDHPHIVRALDARKIGPSHLLIMEYVDGETLHEVVDRLGPLPVAAACEAVRQAASGLAYAHEHGLIHRDIKPSNLMLSREGVVKILDLGLARFALPQAAASAATTTVGLVMGTPDYMAPEQVSDSHTADAKSDVYSLGCVLYRLLSGRAPFEDARHETPMQKMAAQLHEATPPLADARADLPPALVDLVGRMLHKEPAKRIATAQEVAAALAPFARDADLAGLLQREGSGGRVSSAHATLPSIPRRLRWQPAAYGAAAVVAILLAVGWLAQRPWRADIPSPPSDSSSDAQITAAPQATPTPQALSGWIVLSWTRPRLGRPDLWLFSPDGEIRIKLSNDLRSFHIHPRFSPDGRHIAFIRGTDLMSANALCVCEADGRALRVVVSAKPGERFASPVWVSNTRLFYCRDPHIDRKPDLEVWQVDLDGGQPQRVFRFVDRLRDGSGVVTDVAPDRRRLVLVTHGKMATTTGDVYTTDLDGQAAETIWEDSPDEYMDARALWSPDGRWIAWHHTFGREGKDKPLFFGMGLAERNQEGRFRAKLQPQRDAYRTPLAWAPHGEVLCARFENPSDPISRVLLVLVNTQFIETRRLFSLEGTYWQPAQRDTARLADWAIIPADIVSRIHAGKPAR